MTKSTLLNYFIRIQAELGKLYIQPKTLAAIVSMDNKHIQLETRQSTEGS